MRTTYHQINIFLTVAKTSSMRAAAQLLYLTQPAITKQIQILEDVVGEKLFYSDTYDGKKTQLTKAGEKLLPLASNIDHEFQNLHQKIRENIAGAVSTITVITSSSTQDLILDAYAQLRRRSSQISIHIETERAETMLHKFYLNNADLMISPLSISENGIINQKIGEFKLLLTACAKTKYPIREINKKSNNICFISSSTIYEEYQQALAQFSLFKHSLKLSSIQEVKNAILNDLGIGLLPDFLIKKELALGKLIIPKYKFFKSNAYNVYLSMRNKSPRKEVVENFIIALQKHF